MKNKQYYHTAESVQEYIHLAKDVNGEKLIHELKKVLPEGSSLLELGSGPGTDYNILNKPYEVVGSDFSLEFIKHLKSTYPEGEFLHLNASTLESTLTFDGIYSNKVLHHLSDEALTSSIQRQHKVLNTEGIICHSFWNGTGDETFKGMYVNYHNEAELKSLFEPFFELTFIKPYQEFEKDDSLLLVGQKKA